MAELVRYIHLNPVRAGMVKRPEQYKYSGHRPYLGLEPAGVLDVDPVLRHFGATRKVARQAYREFVAAGMKLGHQDKFYLADEGQILEAFLGQTFRKRSVFAAFINQLRPTTVDRVSRPLLFIIGTELKR